MYYVGYLLIIIALFIYIKSIYDVTESKAAWMIYAIGLVIIMSNQATIADYSNYELGYYKSVLGWSVTDQQWLMTMSGYFANKLGMTFQAYRTCIYILGICLLVVAAKKVESDITLFLILYSIFPMMIDAAQTKNFIAMAFLTLGLSELASTSKSKHIKYILLILIGAGFQIILYAYIPLVLFCNKKISKKYRAISIIPILIIAAFFSFSANRDILVTFLLSNASESFINRTKSFFSSHVNLGYLVYIMATLIAIFVMQFTNAFNQETNDTIIQNDYTSIVLQCTYYAIAFIPLYFFRQDFSRLLRNFAPSICIAVSIILSHNRGVVFGRHSIVFTKEKIKIFMITLLYLVYSFYWDIWNYLDGVVKPFFHLR